MAIGAAVISAVIATQYDMVQLFLSPENPTRGELLWIKKGDVLQWSHKQHAIGEYVIEIRRAKK